MENRKKDSGNVIAQIDVNVKMPVLSARDWMSESIDEHLNCVLCGTSLEFYHKVDHIEQKVQEEAHCPHCNVRNREAAHSLQ